MSDSLPSILTALRSAILVGDLRQLPALAERLSTIQEAMPPMSRNEAQAARTLAEDNATLLRASLSGLAAARRRLEQIRQACAGLTTYDHGGKRRSLPADDHPLRRF